MNGVGARSPRGVDDPVDVQIRWTDGGRSIARAGVRGAGIGIRKHDHGRDAHGSASVRDANRNLTPVRDQECSDWQAVIICRLPTDLPQDHVQSSLWAGADSQVVRQVHPADDACGVDEELGRASDVAAILARFGVQDSVAANHFSIRIGKKRICVSAGLAEVVRFLGRIDADCRDFDTMLMKFVEVLLETPQLGVAKRSPIASIENQDYALVAFEQIGQSDLLSVDVRESKLRGGLANVRRAGGRRQLLGENKNSKNKESRDQ